MKDGITEMMDGLPTTLDTLAAQRGVSGLDQFYVGDAPTSAPPRPTMTRSSMPLCGLDVLGAERVGLFDFDIAQIFKAGGELTQQAVNYKNAEDKKNQDVKDSSAKLAAVLAADQQATDALAQAMFSADLAAAAPAGAAKDAAQAKANADEAVAEQMISVQDTTAQGLSADLAAKRLAAAQDALTKATKDAAKAASAAADAPSDPKKKAAAQAALFRVKACQKTAMKAANQDITASGKSAGDAAKEKQKIDEMARVEKPWYAKEIGPLPLWGWGLAVGGLGVVGVGGGFLVKRFLLKR